MPDDIYTPDPRPTPLEWIGPRSFSSPLGMRTVIGIAQNITQLTQILTANTARLGAWIIQGGSVSSVWIGDATVGTNSLTGFPVGRSQILFFPTSGNLWANAGGVQIQVVELFRI